MIWLLLLLTTPVFAQVDLSAIQELDDELPNYQNYKQSDDEVEFQRQNRRFRPPKRVISQEEILRSGTQLGAIQTGARLIDLETNKGFRVTKPIFVEYYNLEDENGFKYIQNKSGIVKWRIPSDYVEPIRQEVDLYVPPHKYTPAPEIIVRSEYDKKLSIPPEVSFYTGVVQGDFMKDLFNDNKAKSGISNQYGIHLFTNWKLPVKAGAVLHYEKSSYSLDKGGQVIYSSPSFGPQFKTREYEFLGNPLRLQAQFRVSPLARARAETVNGIVNVKFNSADLLFSIERPIDNRFGQFVLGLYSQTQWLNLREQPAVNIKASNETNKSIGISFAQVFQ